MRKPYLDLVDNFITLSNTTYSIFLVVYKYKLESCQDIF